MNIVNKKYYWYPYSPETIADYYKGTRLFYDKRDKPAFSDKEIRSAVDQYWARVKGRNTGAFSLPRELGWLPIELEAGKTYNKSLPGAIAKITFQQYFQDGDLILDWLVQKGYLVKYPSGDCFIKEDLGTTITSGLKGKYPGRWEKILSILQNSQTGKSYVYNFTFSQNTSGIDQINPRLTEDYNIYTMDIAANPRLAEAYNDRGNVFFKAGHFDQAIADYNKAVLLKPDLEDAYYNLGFIYYKLGKLSQAVINYSQAIKINPKDSGAYNDRAVIYFKLQEYDKAWNDVNSAEKSGSAVNPQLIDALRQVMGRKN
jgi:tetratricopeptide (TPR) repeat protein